MPLTPRFSGAALVLALLFAAGAGRAGADAIRLVAADAHGVTLELDVPDPEFSAPDADGRSVVSIPGLEGLGDPGRPSLPAAATLVAIPPGAGASARVVGAGPEETRSAKLTALGRPAMRDDGGQLGFVPTIEPVTPIADGPWPGSAVELGEPFTLRRVRLVALRIRPARYDEAAGTVWIRRSLTVRVEYSGGTGPSGRLSEPDRHWDPVLERAVVNFDQARGFRASLKPSTTPALELLRGSGAARRPGRFGGLPSSGSTLGVPAFDEDNTEVRVLIDTTGVHSLTYANLSSQGFPAGVDVNRISVHRHEFVEGGNPPYVTIELPIEVDDRNSNGVFDATDRIVLFVQSWAERSRASVSQRAWGDGEVVYVTSLSDRDGLRMPSQPGWLNASVTPLTSHYVTAHFEKTYPTIFLGGFNPGVPGFTPAESDTNTDQFIWTDVGHYNRFQSGFSDLFPFETNDLDTGRPLTVTVQWQGLRSNVHINWAEVRNGSNVYTTVVDSAQWSGLKTLTLGNTFPGTTLSEGRTNALRLWGRTGGAPNDIVNVGLNWFEVRYARRYRAMLGMLRCNSDSTVGDFEIHATGFFTRNVRVYDVTDSLAPVRLTIADSLISTGAAPYTVRFQGTSPSGAWRSYAVFDIPHIVPAAKMSLVTRARLYAKPPADNVLIAPELLAEPAQRLADHRTAQGLRSLVCPLEALNDEYNGGRKSSYAIRRFLQFAYNNWGTKFVLLVGDGSQDPQNSVGSAGPDLVPAQRIGGPVGIPDGSTTVYESVVSDPWYVWCLSCPGAPNGPKLHDMFIGRLPVSTLAMASDVVDKLIAYDDLSGDQSWRRRMLIVADDQYSTQSFFGGDPGGPRYCFKYYEIPFKLISQELRDVVLNEAGLQESDFDLFDLAEYLKNEPTHLDPVYGTCRDSWTDTQNSCHISVTPQMFQFLNDGQVWWNFQGHANPYVLTHENLYVNLGLSDDKIYFHNDKKPFLFSAFSCHPNAFGSVVEGDLGRGPSMGEDLVNLPGKGAIGSWASSAYEILPYDSQRHINIYFARALFADPPRDPYLGHGGARAILGESIALALVRNLATASGLEAQVGITYHLLGDPATPISIGPPQMIVTANTLPVTSGDPVRMHTTGDTLRLEADVVSNVRLTSLSLDRTLHGASTTLPPADYQVVPAFPDTGAASKGGRRFHLTYRTTLAPDSYTFTIRSTDRYGVPRAFDAAFPFQSVLRAGGIPIGPNEPVAKNAPLVLTVVSPAPLTLPSQLVVTINNQRVDYGYAPANGDPSGREWTLTIPHDDFVPGDYSLVAQAQGGATATHVFVVEAGGDQVGLRNVYAFPNPFEEQRGTYFSFRLAGSSPADVQLRVYTVAGRLIYRRTLSALPPGYQQIGWDGTDAEGQPISNGLYVYKLLATNGASSDVVQGRLVKVRLPRHVDETESAP